MDVPPELAPDDVLAQPTRARLFALLSELRRPGATVELAQHLRLHPNGVRVHLERMESGGQAPHAYADLGRWLARAIRPQTGALRDVQTAGREIGDENQPVICTLHRGITVGLLDVLDRDAEVTEFVPHDPDAAGCTIEISRPAAGARRG